MGEQAVARLGAALCLSVVYALGGLSALVGFVAGVLVMQAAYRARFGQWFDFY